LSNQIRRNKKQIPFAALRAGSRFPRNDTLRGTFMSIGGPQAKWHSE